jgi:RimJ/RimL family protein N-acetyltransferase
VNDAPAAFSIRATRPGDLAAYRDLRLEALRLHPEAFGADYETCRAWPDEEWENRVERGAGDEASITLVAQAPDSSLVGMMGVFRGDGPKAQHGGLIWGVYVREAWRGRGVADALLGACLDWARERGLRWVKLAVVTTNAPAIRLYARSGFSVYGVEPEVIFTGGVYHDELLMARRLF